MIETYQTIKPILQAAALVSSLYWIPYLIRTGWNDAENRTKKVCDTCFRDIKKYNEKLKEVKQ